jgi:hypothetical protein
VVDRDVLLQARGVAADDIDLETLTWGPIPERTLPTAFRDRSLASPARSPARSLHAPGDAARSTRSRQCCERVDPSGRSGRNHRGTVARKRVVWSS